MPTWDRRKPLALLVLVAGMLVSTVATAQACIQREHVVAFLTHEQDMTLRGWGIDIDGNMLELFISEGGRFAVLTTSPNKCSTLIWAEEHGGRLVDPPSRNLAVPPAPKMDRGEPL